MQDKGSGVLGVAIVVAILAVPAALTLPYSGCGASGEWICDPTSGQTITSDAPDEAPATTTQP